MMDELRNEIEEVKRSFADELGHVQSHQDIALLREKYFSRKKGIVTGFFDRLKTIETGRRPQAGKLVNGLRAFISERLAAAEAPLAARTPPRGRWTDCTLPLSELPLGHLHPLNFVRSQIEELFQQLGYEIADGPEIESEFHNFDALNFLPEHPARDEQDTFFVADFPDLILRTHTSPVQIRYMMAHRPPIRIIAPGKVFRKDNPDATHTPVFHQIEGLLVDRGVTFSHLKGTLEHFVRRYFGPGIRTRFRPSYFPFTEPSAETDISCFICPGDDPDCRICKGKGWLEIGGSGMVHPQVLRNCGIDPARYSGFAFGMGIERMTIIKYGVPDLRMLYDNDLRIIEQLG